MPTVSEIIEAELNLFNTSIQQTMSDKNMDASGNAARSLTVEQRGYIFVSVGIDYIEYLNRGRPPGKFPPMAAIERWVNLKGLKIDPFVIARNIADNGTRIFRNRELGLKLEDKTTALEASINKVLPKFVADQIKTAFNKALTGK